MIFNMKRGTPSTSCSKQLHATVFLPHLPFARSNLPERIFASYLLIYQNDSSGRDTFQVGGICCYRHRYTYELWRWPPCGYMRKSGMRHREAVHFKEPRKVYAHPLRITFGQGTGWCPPIFLFQAAKALYGQDSHFNISCFRLKNVVSL